MGKKIYFSIVGGIAVCGLIVAIVGFSMGGRPGSFTVSGGQFVYYNGTEVIPVINTPSWWGWGGHGELDESPSSASLIDGGMHAPFKTGELRGVDIKIPAGRLVIQAGADFGLAVDGPMRYTSRFADGVWEIRSYLSGVISVGSGEGRRYLHEGENVTTTFTLTLPAGFETLDMDVGVGEATLEGLTLEQLRCGASQGTIRVNGLAAKNATFTVDMGKIDITGFSGGVCELDCNMGSIQFSGSITDTLNASCDMGSITAQLPRPAQYGWDASVGMGSIRIDGDKVVNGWGDDNGGNRGAKPFFDLDCGMGSIKINFN